MGIWRIHEKGEFSIEVIWKQYLIIISPSLDAPAFMLEIEEKNQGSKSELRKEVLD